MNEVAQVDGTADDDAVASRLGNEIQNIGMELNRTLTLLGHELRAPTTTKKGNKKKSLEVKVMTYKLALRNKILELEFFLEEKRVRECFAEAKELETIVEPEQIDCPICLDTISTIQMPSKPGSTGEPDYITLGCCGKLLCVGCHDAMMERFTTEENRQRDKVRAREVWICPCCRAPIPGSYEQVGKIVTKRSQQGCSWSQFTLAQKYELGRDGLDVDLCKAAYWFGRSAEQGHTIAQCEMGRFHRYGLGGCEQSDANAEKCFTLAAAKNDPRAQRNLVCLMEKNGRYNEAFQWATILAAQGHRDGQNLLSGLYLNDDAVGIPAKDQDPRNSSNRALYWAKKAAVLGDIKMNTIVGILIKMINREFFGDFFENCEALYWQRQGALLGCEMGKARTTELEAHSRSFCGGCKKNGKFVSC